MSKLNIHIRLRQARRFLKLNQSDIANDLNIQQKTISDIENGKIINIPNSYIYYFYSKGVSLEWIYDNKGGMMLQKNKSSKSNKSLFDTISDNANSNKTAEKEDDSNNEKNSNNTKKADDNMYERLIDSKDTTINTLQNFMKVQENNMDFIKDLLLKIFNKK